jgi:hypothetical protein
MRRFTVCTVGKNQLHLRALCEAFANDLWIPDHLTPEQASNFALDYFTRTIDSELKLLSISCDDTTGP